MNCVYATRTKLRQSIPYSIVYTLQYWSWYLFSKCLFLYSGGRGGGPAAATPQPPKQSAGAPGQAPQPECKQQ